MRLYTLLLAFLLATPIFYSHAQTKKSKITLLAAKNFKEKIDKTKNKQLIDVRTPEEFKTGYIAGAVNIDFNDASFENNIKKLDKTKPIFVYCKVGGRSEDAAKKLATAGFKKIYDLKGGVMSWTNNKLLLEGVPKIDVNIPAKTTALSVEEFSTLTTSAKVVIIDFYAVWCGPCKRLSPMLEKFEEEYGDKIKVIKIDVDKNPTISNYFRIESIPLIHFYKNGKLINQVMGLPGNKELKNEIEKLIK